MGYLENHVSSAMIAENLEQGLVRNNQDISENLSILAFPFLSARLQLCEQRVPETSGVRGVFRRTG